MALGSARLPVPLPVSQAEDESSQTPPDYTVRPNIKIHNIGEWLQAAEAELSLTLENKTSPHSGAGLGRPERLPFPVQVLGPGQSCGTVV